MPQKQVVQVALLASNSTIQGAIDDANICLLNNTDSTGTNVPGMYDVESTSVAIVWDDTGGRYVVFAKYIALIEV